MAGESERGARVRTRIGVTLLLAQVGMIVWARFHPMRYYCWAPYDSLNAYSIEVRVGGRMLTPGEVQRRYRLRSTGVNPRAIYQVIDIVSHAERAYHEGEQARVTVAYRTNGGAEESWSWPIR